MIQGTITYRSVVATVVLTMLALLASACKSPTEFDIPQHVDSTQVGDTVISLASSNAFISPFTQTISVNGFIFFHEVPLGKDPTGSFAGTFIRKAGHTAIGIALNLQHDPAQSYYGTAGFIPYQAVGLTLNVPDMPVDSLSIQTHSADESDGIATLTVAEYDPIGGVIGVKSVPATAYVATSIVTVTGAPNGSPPVQMIQIQIRLTSTYVDNSGGNVFFYRVDGMLFIPWP